MRESRPVHAGGLARDQRGAILITAIAMGAVLVAAVLYVLDAGDAIVTRERLQSAADATAFESAIWHARGMNAIAVLNILMSLALAVIAVLRQVELVCVLIPGGQSCVQPVLRFEERVTPFVDTSLNVLQRMQVAVAAGTPLYALIASSQAASDAAEDGALELRGNATSLALLPVAVDALLEAAPAPQQRPGEPERFERDRIGTAFPKRLPDVLGEAGLVMPSLPVQAGSFETLCGKSTSFVAGQIEELLDRYGDVPGVGTVLDFIGGTITGRIARPLLRWAGENFSSLLCRPARDVLDDTVRTIAEQACSAHEEQRNEEREQIQRENEERDSDDQREVPPPWSQRDQEECMDEEEEQAREQGGVPSFEAVPAQVYDLAENGNPFLHTWARVQTRIPDDAPPSFEPLEAVAEAEYYFDCDEGWGGCSGDALWRPGWTARMRRYRLPHHELDLAGFIYDRALGAARAHAGSFIDAYLESSIEDLLAGTACSGNSAASRLCDTVASRVVDPITDWIAERAESVVNGRFPTGQAAVENTAGSAMQGGARWGIDWLIDKGIQRVESFAGDHGVAVPDTRGYRHDPRIH